MASYLGASSAPEAFTGSLTIKSFLTHPSFAGGSCDSEIPKVFRSRMKSTRKGGPVDQPGMSIVECFGSARRLNRPLGMREVAGSNPARSTRSNALFPV